MKKMNYRLAVIAAMLACCFDVAHAQWNTTGNAATSTNFIGTTNSIPLRLRTNNVQRMIIDSLGRVGVGIAFPRQLFTVQSSGTVPAASWITSGSPVFAGYGEGAAGNADFNLLMASSTAINARGVFGMKRSRGTLAAPTAVLNNDQLGSLLVSGYDGSNFQGAAAVDFFADGTPTAGNVPVRIGFVTGSNSTNRAERLRIGNTGDIAMNTSQFFLQRSTGNVGIGTATPTENMVVSEPAGATSGTQNFLAVETVINPLVPSTQGILIRKDDGVKRGFKLYQSGSDDGNSVFKIASFNGGADVDRLTVRRDNGNVGIGTTSPTAALEVAGQVKITGGAPGAGKVLVSDNNGLASWSTVTTAGAWSATGNTGINEATQFLGTTDSNAVIIRTNNQEALRVLPNLPIASGAVADPVDVLRIQRAGTFNNKWFVNASFQLGSFDPGINASTQMDIALNDQGNPIYPPNKVMSLRSNGFVGIGNTSPTTTLDVNGVGKFGNYLKIGTDVAEGYFQNAQDGAYRALATGGDQGYFFQNTNGANTSMYVGLNGTYAGRVGIGTAAPAANLDVLGKIKVTDGTQGTGKVLTCDSNGVASWTTPVTSPWTVSGNNIANSNSGNVGIGTTSPQAKLHVTGNSIIDGRIAIGGVFPPAYILDVAGTLQWTAKLNNTTNNPNQFCNGMIISAGSNTFAGNQHNFLLFVRPDQSSIGGIVQTSASSVAYVTTSDERLKTNIENTRLGLADLNKIQVKDYYYNDDKNTQQTGFLAQQLYTIFPNAVAKGGENAKTNPWMVDYGRLTPLLVKSIQELSAQNTELKAKADKVDDLQQQINELKAMLTGNNAKTTAAVTEQNVSFGSITLGQNVPNPPVSNFTRISYEIPVGAAKAQMVISDEMGRTIKQLTLVSFGKGQLNIDTKALTPGTYSYTLMVDGKVIDTRQMVIVRQ